MINKDIINEIINRCELREKYIFAFLLTKNNSFIKNYKFLDYGIKDLIKIIENNNYLFLKYLENNHIKKIQLKDNEIINESLFLEFYEIGCELFSMVIYYCIYPELNNGCYCDFNKTTYNQCQCKLYGLSIKDKWKYEIRKARKIENTYICKNH